MGCFFLSGCCGDSELKDTCERINTAFYDAYDAPGREPEHRVEGCVTLMEGEDEKKLSCIRACTLKEKKFLAIKSCIEGCDEDIHQWIFKDSSAPFEKPPS